MDLLEVIRNNKELNDSLWGVRRAVDRAGRPEAIHHPRYDGPPGGRLREGRSEPSRDRVLRQRAERFGQTSRTIFGLWALGLIVGGPPGGSAPPVPGPSSGLVDPWTGQPPPQSLNGLPPTDGHPAIPGRTLYPADWGGNSTGVAGEPGPPALLRICAIAALACCPAHCWGRERPPRAHLCGSPANAGEFWHPDRDRSGVWVMEAITFLLAAISPQDST